jgi:hypothetical protein
MAEDAEADLALPPPRLPTAQALREHFGDRKPAPDITRKITGSFSGPKRQLDG